MVKRPKTDDSGDNDELQALFDSIAEQQAPAAPTPVAAPVAAPIAAVPASGDSDELQALFDSVASGSEAKPPAVAQPEVSSIKEAVVASAGLSFEERQKQAYVQIGQLTRLLHDTIRQLGYDKMLEQTAQQLPDARQRLSYISQMTEQAASRVLNATDIAKPIQEAIGEESKALAARWDDLYAGKLSVDQFKELAGTTRAFISKTHADSEVLSEQLLEIMMAQDFQDLTGQVIKKIVDMAATLEGGLLKVLIDIMPESQRTLAEDGLLNGPVVNSTGRDDVVTSQEQVDDLLDSLGF